MRRDRKLLIGAASLALATWLVPYLKPIGLPLLYLNTHIHELFHALTAVGTGGSADLIAVYGDGSGETPVRGGFILFVASAGYIGSAVLGGLLIYFSRTSDVARRAMGTMAIVLGLSLVLWVRADLVGILSGVFWVGALAFAARYLRGEAAIVAGQFLGVQQAMNGLQSLLVLLNISVVGERQSDAGIMAARTGIPPVFWALMWVAVSFVCVVWAIRKAWRAPIK
ncbi:MAG: hypothetical protein HONBIEJF_03031 [Fimbriimonadaceae bacterium]|nr:hypothetical protein [Fimbriimonadaceae bacterium]